MIDDDFNPEKYESIACGFSEDDDLIPEEEFVDDDGIPFDPEEHIDEDDPLHGFSTGFYFGERGNVSLIGYHCIHCDAVWNQESIDLGHCHNCGTPLPEEEEDIDDDSLALTV